MRVEGQSEFATALLNPDAPLPEGIIDPNGKPAPKRFAVYRNNVTISLIEALAATFSSVQALVGEAFFAEMARTFVRSNPPKSPLLTEYGRDFPQFIAGFEPASALPFLADVARVDRAWLVAYHAADALPLNPTGLAGMDDAAVMAARFKAHPAAHLVQSPYPAGAIWRAAKAGQAAAGIDPAKGDAVLVTRPDVEVKIEILLPEEGVFFRAILDGEQLGDAVEKAMAGADDFDLGRGLGLLLNSGMCAGIA